MIIITKILKYGLFHFDYIYDKVKKEVLKAFRRRFTMLKIRITYANEKELEEALKVLEEQFDVLSRLGFC